MGEEKEEEQGKKEKRKKKKKKPPSEGSSEKSSIFSVGRGSIQDDVEGDVLGTAEGEPMNLESTKSVTRALAEMSEVYKAAKVGVADLGMLRQSKTAKAEALKDECNAWRSKSDELWHQIRDLRSQLHRSGSEVVPAVGP